MTTAAFLTTLPPDEVDTQLAFELWREEQVEGLIERLHGEGGERNKLSPEALSILVAAKLG
jgi:hypothetical protein